MRNGDKLFGVPAKDGRGKGRGMLGGMRKGKNTGGCKVGGPGYGMGGGRGRGRNRKG